MYVGDKRSGVSSKYDLPQHYGRCDVSARLSVSDGECCDVRLALRELKWVEFDEI